jgi:crossover junction endodeoxyribonuclease RuvC
MQTIVLAIDPGYERLGIAIIEKVSGKKEQLLFSICFKTPTKLNFHDRLKLIGKEIELVISKHNPSVLAIESLFFNTNQKTAMHVAEVRGGIMLIALLSNLTIYEYTPLQIKSAIAGNGRADKKQIISMLPHLIKIEKNIKYDDEYDAIAIGLTYTAHNHLLLK